MKRFALNKKTIFRLFTAVFIISSVLSLTLPAVTEAATLSSTSSLKDQVYSYALYNSMIDCLSQDNQQKDNSGIVFISLRTSEANMKSGTWWRTGGSVYVGSTQGAESPASYLSSNTRGTSGDTLCNDIVKDSATEFGYSSIFNFACAFIDSRANGSSCATGTGDFKELSPNIAKFKSVISKKVWGNNSPSITVDSANKNAGLYLIYREAFLTGCSAKVSANPGANFAYKDIKIVTDSGSVSTDTYEGLDRSTSIATYKPNDSSTEKKSCADIASLVNKYADDFKAYLGANPTDKGGSTTVVNGCGNTTYASAHPDECKSTTPADCTIDGIGWIVCPIVNFMAKIADGAFSFLSTNLLRTDPNLVKSGTSSPTFTAWTYMRTIANVVFVILFLIIIFSQLTSLGVSNYGVKKMLPRLVIAAILVNVSFYVCQVAVDISNILGFSLKDAFGGIGDSITTSANLKATTPFNNGNGFSGIAGGALAIVGGGAIVYALLSTLIPVLLAALVALIMILFLLIARQALIVILTVLSPLAFVAFLLPNTEQYFTKWRKLFLSLLLLFPIISLVFGLSSLAHDVLSTTFNATGTDGESNGANAMFGQVIGAAVLVLPLFVVPSLLKKSLDGIGSMSGKIQAIGAKTGGAAGKAGGGAFANSWVGRGQALRKQGRQNYRNQRFAKQVAKGGIVAAMAKGVPITRTQRAANKAVDRYATQAAASADAEDVKAQQLSLENKIYSSGGAYDADKAFDEARQKGDLVGMKAATNIQFQTAGGRTAMHTRIKEMESVPPDQRTAAQTDAINGLRQHIATQHPNVEAQDASLGHWSHNEGDMSKVEKEVGTYQLNDQKMAGQSKKSLVEAHTAGVLDAAGAQRILNNNDINKDIKPAEREFLTHISTGGSLRNGIDEGF